MSKAVIDTPAVTLACQATGLSQAGMARLLGVEPSTIMRWTNGMPMRPWTRDILLRIQSTPAEVRGEVYRLVREGKNVDALAVILSSTMQAAA